jgi:hypothetical protein
VKSATTDQRHDLLRAHFGKESDRVLADDERDERGRAARRHPVAPADDEARVVAEAVADEDVLPAGARNERAELGERVGAEERVKRADDPDRDERPEGLEVLGDDAGRAEDARADGVPDRDGQPKPTPSTARRCPREISLRVTLRRAVYPEERSDEGSMERQRGPRLLHGARALLHRSFASLRIGDATRL